MPEWMKPLKGDPIPWLLEPDPDNPGVRYFALIDLLDQPADDPEVVAARQALMETGPVPAILAEQHVEGRPRRDQAEVLRQVVDVHVGGEEVRLRDGEPRAAVALLEGLEELDEQA